MGYEITISFDKWGEFLNFMSDLHNREMKYAEEDYDMRKNFNPRFENLEDEDEDIEELMQKYPIAFEDTSRNEAEIKKIHLITEKMAKRPNEFLKPASAITTAYILSKIKKEISSDKLFLALPMTIAALFRVKCGEKFDDVKKRHWQDNMDLSLFLLMEYGFNGRGIENALEILDKYNLIDIDKDYSQDKNNPRITYHPNQDLYNLLLEDEIPY